MIRWLIVVFLALVLFNGLMPWLQKFGFGKLPGDFTLHWRGRPVSVPLGSVVSSRWMWQVPGSSRPLSSWVWTSLRLLITIGVPFVRVQARWTSGSTMTRRVSKPGKSTT